LTCWDLVDTLEPFSALILVSRRPFLAAPVKRSLELPPAAAVVLRVSEVRMELGPEY
jgi:hypothetical protein